MQSKKTKEVVFYLVLFLVCAIYVINALTTLKMGTPKAPGPAFLPVIAGSLAALISLAYFASNLKEYLQERAAAKDGEGLTEEEKSEQREALKKNLFLFAEFILASVVYLILFKKVNFYILSAVYMTILGKIFRLKGWLKPILLGVGFSVFVYLVFKVAFNVYL
jgi:hypothetical protein